MFGVNWRTLTKDSMQDHEQIHLYGERTSRSQIDFYLALFVAMINLRRRLNFAKYGNIVNRIINFYYVNDERFP